MEQCLVTGGAGFIGSHIVDGLVREGYRVRVLDDLSSGFLENLKTHQKNIEFVEGDIRNRELVEKTMKGVDFVLHQAALRAVQRSVDDPWQTNEVNVTGTLNLLIAARNAKVKKFLYASSSSVYGENPQDLKKEDYKLQPISPYAASKVAKENYATIFSKLYGMETVGFRYFNVFGPRQSPFSQYALVIPIFMQRLCDNQEIEIHGDGKQTRDFSYIDNIVSANLLALKSNTLKSRIFNVGCGETHSILDLYYELEKITGKKGKMYFAPARPGDMRVTWADLSLIQKELGYKVLVGFKEGLQKTFDWYLKSRNNVSVKS